MTRMWKLIIGAILIAILSTSPILLAQEHQDEVRKDLFSVITLQGHPCGKVTDFQKLGQDDYIATCQNGNRYRVRVISGRVTVEKQ